MEKILAVHYGSECTILNKICFFSLQPNNPYNNPYLAPHAAAHLLSGLSPLSLNHLSPLHHSGSGYQPYRYDIGIVPECAYTNKHYYNLTFCLQDDFYPT